MRYGYIDVPVSRIQAIVDEKRSITGDTALRLGRYFGTTAEFRLNLQRDFDLERAEILAGADIQAKVKPRAA
jgi:addiction module HigA family antidote